MRENSTCTVSEQDFPFYRSNCSEQEVTPIVQVQSRTANEPTAICYGSRKNHAKT
jgi:predicted RNA-binding protein with PUA-like domain